MNKNKQLNRKIKKHRITRVKNSNRRITRVKNSNRRITFKKHNLNNTRKKVGGLFFKKLKSNQDPLNKPAALTSKQKPSDPSPSVIKQITKKFATSFAALNKTLKKPDTTKTNIDRGDKNTGDINISDKNTDKEGDGDENTGDINIQFVSDTRGIDDHGDENAYKETKDDINTGDINIQFDNEEGDYGDEVEQIEKYSRTPLIDFSTYDALQENIEHIINQIIKIKNLQHKYIKINTDYMNVEIGTYYFIFMLKYDTQDKFNIFLTRTIKPKLEENKSPEPIKINENYSTKLTERCKKQGIILNQGHIALTDNKKHSSINTIRFYISYFMIPQYRHDTNAVTDAMIINIFNILYYILNKQLELKNEELKDLTKKYRINCDPPTTKNLTEFIKEFSSTAT
jgi:hypothetical protein